MADTQMASQVKPEAMQQGKPAHPALDVHNLTINGVIHGCARRHVPVWMEEMIRKLPESHR